MRRTRPGASQPRGRPQSSARRAPTGSLLGAGWSPRRAPLPPAVIRGPGRAHPMKRTTSRPTQPAARTRAGRAVRRSARSHGEPPRHATGRPTRGRPPRPLPSASARRRRPQRRNSAERRDAPRTRVGGAALAPPSGPGLLRRVVRRHPWHGPSSSPPSSWWAATRCPAGPAALSTTTPDDPPSPP